MKSLFIVSAFILSLSASAASGLGSECGLRDDVTEMEEVGTTIVLSHASNSKINSLKTIYKQQLIITAKEFAPDFGYEESIKSAVDAVEFFRENSESSDIQIEFYVVDGEYFTAITFFPGGNQVGLIFETNRLRAIASNGDGTLVCK